MLLPSLRLQNEPISTGSAAAFPWSETLARRFSLMTRFGDPYSMFKASGKNILLPRAVAPVGQHDDRRVGVPIDVKRIVDPKNAEQHRLNEEMCGLLGKGESFILRAGTGTGKTFLACSAIASVGRKTLVIVPKEDLMKQWPIELQKFLGLKAHEIGIIQGSKVSVTGKKVILGMIQSLSLEDRYDSAIFDDIGFLIIDEVHRAAADQLSQCLMQIPALLRLGLSATPVRADGKEQVIYAHIGPIKVESDAILLTPKVLTFQSGFKVPIVKLRDKETGQVKMGQLPHSPGKVAHVVKLMNSNTSRNEMLGKLIAMAYSRGRNIVVFTDQLDHVETLVWEAGQHGVPHDQVARYVGGMKESAREAAKARRVMIATWGMFAEGTDVPWLDTAILATPRSAVTQAVGRILREYPNKKEPLVIDLVDGDSKVFKGYANKRRLWYQSIGAEVIDN